MTASSVSNYALSPDIVILTNTPVVQAVKKTALGVEAANFWTHGNSSADLIAVSDKASVITWDQSTNLLVGVFGSHANQQQFHHRDAQPVGFRSPVR